MLDQKNKDKDSTELIPLRKIHFYKINNEQGEIGPKIDELTPEVPLEIKLCDNRTKVLRTIAITMRTPGDEIFLALGFLFTEGVIASHEEIISIQYNTKNQVLVELKHWDDGKLKSIERNFYTSSSCGICSKSSLEQLYPESPYLPFSSKFKIKGTLLVQLIDYFKKDDSIFNRTGACHSNLLLDQDLKLLARFEDVGRHNAMDKLLGYCISNQLLPLSKHIVAVSGRISFELVQKASMAGVGMIAGLGAPSDMAVDEAFAQNITLIGFVKSKGFNIYTGIERVI